MRGLLYARHGGVCAFCGCDLPRNDRGDVEHFRPKGKVEDDQNHGGYWWLAYDLNNYLLSCSLCNRVRKKDRFPLRPGGRRRVTYGERHRLRQEARLLLHPEWDPVEEWLRVEWQERLCLIRPRENLPPPSRKRAQLVIRFFRLNEDPRLVRERNRVRADVVQALDEGRLIDARRCAIRFRPHSLVARQILADRSPQHLPSLKEELQWLLQDALQELRLAMELQDDPDLADDSQVKLTKELLWTFAALWSEPLTGHRRVLAARGAFPFCACHYLAIFHRISAFVATFNFTTRKAVVPRSCCSCLVLRAWCLIRGCAFMVARAIPTKN